MPTLLVVLSLLFLVPIYLLVKRLFGSHPLDKLPGPQPPSWVKGHFSEIFGINGFDFHAKIAAEYGPTFCFRSAYGERQLYTYDPKALYHILVKDQMTLFEETPAFLETFRLMFGGGLLGSHGNPHRKQRKLLMPVFSIAHMRNMVPIFYDVAHNLERTLIAKVQNGTQELDMLSWMSRTALELVGQAGLGYSFDDLGDEERAHPYVKIIKQLSPLVTRAQFSRNFLPYISPIGNPKIRRLGAWALSYLSKDFQDGKAMADFMWDLCQEIFESKKENRTVGVGEQLGGKDIISVLLKENERASDEDRLEEDELIGQMSTIIFAAMDTTSSALSRTLTLLATYPEVQKRLREEVEDAFEDGDIPYDRLVSLPYLDAIARETLRLYPPIHRLMRTTLRDTTLPLLSPVTCTDGSIIDEVVMPKNTDIFVSIFNSNRNKALWGEDADVWKPERWLSPLPSSVVDAKIPGIYSHLMTFNGGGRSCIGFKFSQLEMKVVLSLLIRTFEFSNTGKEIYWQSSGVSSPIVRDPGSSGHPEMPMLVGLVKKKV